jgi:hypothetical protein
MLELKAGGDDGEDADTIDGGLLVVAIDGD